MHEFKSLGLFWILLWNIFAWTSLEQSKCFERRKICLWCRSEEKRGNFLHKQRFTWNSRKKNIKKTCAGYFFISVHDSLMFAQENVFTRHVHFFPSLSHTTQKKTSGSLNSFQKRKQFLMIKFSPINEKILHHRQPKLNITRHNTKKTTSLSLWSVWWDFSQSMEVFMKICNFYVPVE